MLQHNVVSGAIARDGIRLNDVSNSTFGMNIVRDCANKGFSMDDALNNPDFPGVPSVGNTFSHDASDDNLGYGFYVNPITGEGHVYRKITCQGNGLGGSNQDGVCD